MRKYKSDWNLDVLKKAKSFKKLTEETEAAANQFVKKIKKWT